MTAPMDTTWLGPIRQISYTTSDLDGLVRFWEAQVGIGPWNVFRGLRLNMTYEGRMISLPVDLALTLHGGILFELMQVRGDGPSPFHDALNRPIIGLQRLAATSKDIVAEAQKAVARGMEMFAEGRDASGQRYYYFRSSAAPGVILELLEEIPSFSQFVDRLEARARVYAGATVERSPLSVASLPADAPSDMRAALLRNYGGVDQFTIERVPVPPPGEGEIRVRVAGAAVNQVDVKARLGLLKEWMPLTFPARLGGDVSGIVDAVGSGVADFRVGDRVMGMIDPTTNGSYGEYVVSAAASFARVPDGLDLIDAAAIPTGVMTGIQLVERGLGPISGAKVLVLGAGGSAGRAAVMAAYDAGAIVYAGIRASSRAAVADLPLAGVIDISDPDGLAAAGPFDCLADTVGGSVAESLFSYVRQDGVVASIAVPAPNPPSASTQRFTQVFVVFDRARLERFARDLVDRKRVVPVAHRLPLADVAEAHRLMEQGAVGGKIVIVP